MKLTVSQFYLIVNAIMHKQNIGHKEAIKELSSNEKFDVSDILKEKKQQLEKN